MQETSDTRDKEKECIHALNNYNIDNTDLTRRTLKVLHDFQSEISRDCHVQHVSASNEFNSLDTILLNRKINELDGFNDTIRDSRVNLKERGNPKTAEHECSAVSSLFAALSKNTSEEKEILLRPMDILFKADTQGNVPHLMTGGSNPGTSRLKILINLYSKKFTGENMEEHKKSIMHEIMHTLEACWKSRFILYEKLVDDHVAFGKILPSEIAEKFVRSLFLTKEAEKYQHPSSMIEGNNPCVMSGKRILSRYLSKVASSSIPSNLLQSKKYGSIEEPIPSFPQHKAAVEALKLKRKKREIMARVTRQRSLDHNSMTNPADSDLC